jgi:hypothetical protein
MPSPPVPVTRVTSQQPTRPRISDIAHLIEILQVLGYISCPQVQTVTQRLQILLLNLRSYPLRSELH